MDRLPVDLRELRSFVAIADQQSFGRAAIQLDIAQPSLTLQIQKLERELGVTLLRRTSRVVELTEAGRTLLADARALLAQAHAAVDTVRLAGRGEIGALALGFYDSAPLIIVPTLLRRFRSRYPNVRLTLIERSSRESLAALARGDLDAALLRGPIPGDVFDSRLVATETLLVAMPDTHPLAQQATVDIEQLREAPFVLLPRSKGSGLYDEIISLCHKHGFSPIVVQEANETHTVCGLVAAGIGVSMVPASVRALAVRGIAYRPLVPETKIERYVAHLKTARSPALAAFIDMLPDIPLAL